jgi:hypothetical protein
MKLPEFQTAHLLARRDMMKQVHARMQQSCRAALSVQLMLMADAKTSASIRARVSQYILESGNKSLDQDITEGLESGLLDYQDNGDEEYEEYEVDGADEVDIVPELDETARKKLIGA